MVQNKFKKIEISVLCIFFSLVFVFIGIMTCQKIFASAEMFSSAKDAVVIETSTKRKLFALNEQK